MLSHSQAHKSIHSYKGMRTEFTKQVAFYLGESKEEVAKRKKGAQGIPIAALKDQNKLMRFMA